MCVGIGATDAKGSVELKSPMEGIKNVRFKKIRFIRERCLSLG